MEIITFLIDFILNVDEHLKDFVATYGAWVYALLFLIIFTGNRRRRHAVPAG